MTIYLVNAQHWAVPGARQYAATSADEAAEKAVDWTNDLIAEARDTYLDAPDARDACPVRVQPGGDWRGALHGLARAMVMEQEAVNALEADEYIASQGGIETMIADESESFPAVWITEVESAPVQPVRVFVALSGGCFTGATTDAAPGAVRVLLCDYDVDGADEANLVTVGREKARVWDETLETDGAWLDAIDEQLNAPGMADDSDDAAPDNLEKE